MNIVHLKIRYCILSCFQILCVVVVINMPDYKKMYLHLFNHVSDELEALEHQNFGQAKEILVAAQQQAEDEYVESE